MNEPQDPQKPSDPTPSMSPPPGMGPRPQQATPAAQNIPDVDFQAMDGNGFSQILHHLLKSPMSVVYEIKNGKQSPLMALSAIAVTCLAVFGLVLGMFSAGDQLWAAPVKVIGGVFFSSLICLPSLYIFGCLSGMDARVKDVGGLMITMVAMTALLLVGFAPVVWLFSTSSNSLVFFGFLSLAIWFVCVIFGLRVVTRASKSLGGGRGGHLQLWTIIFFLVTLQMTTTLRPIIGSSDTFMNLQEKKFFLVHWFDQMDGSPEKGRKAETEDQSEDGYTR